MSRLGNDILRGHRDLAKQLGKPTFKWNNGDYACIANDAGSGGVFGAGGIGSVSDLVLFVEAAILPNPGPQLKHTIIYKGKTYRIDHIVGLPGDAELKFTCVDPTRGV